MRQILKIIALIMALFIISIIYIIDALNTMQYRIDNIGYQIDNIESDTKLIFSTLEQYENELSYCYNEEVSDIYDELNKLNEMIQQKTQDSNKETQDSDIENQISNGTYDKLDKPSDDENNKQTKEQTNTQEETVENKQTETEATNVLSSNNDYNDIYVDMADLYYGKLCIPDVNININLYYGHQQYITDRVDSANIYSFDDFAGYTIADHNNQEFSKLFNVKVGTTGYIEHQTFGRINIVCTDILSGYNTGKYIVDENGDNTMNITDFMMYTCNRDSDGVLICLWKKTY